MTTQRYSTAALLPNRFSEAPKAECQSPLEVFKNIYSNFVHERQNERRTRRQEQPEFLKDLETALQSQMKILDWQRTKNAPGIAQTKQTCLAIIQGIEFFEASTMLQENTKILVDTLQRERDNATSSAEFWEKRYDISSKELMALLQIMSTPHKAKSHE